MPYRKPLAITIAALLGLPVAFAQVAPKPAAAGSGNNDNNESASPTTGTGTSVNTGASTTSGSATTPNSGGVPGSGTTDAGSTGEAVIITGSNIKRTDYEGPQTVKVIDRQAIDRSGVRTVTDLIARLPENSAGFTEAVNNGNSFSPGAAASSLRGLGDSATLVLINGRRVAPFGLPQNGTDSFVDLNSIPLAAVERVEILKEGASAIYGSDAIAGVINIILKDNYSGGEVESTYGNTTRRDMSEFRESALSGFQNEKFHIMVTGNYYHRDSLADVDRPYSISADHRNLGGTDLRSSFGNPGTVFTDTDAFAIPRGSNGTLDPATLVSGSAFKPDGSIRNRYNFNRVSELLPETERWGGLATFGYNLTPHLELFGEASYQEVKTHTHIAPTPIDVIVPATNPFNPFGTDVEVLQRSVETGNRTDIDYSDNYRAVGGIKFKDLPFDWSGEASFLYSENDIRDDSVSGFLSTKRVNGALADTNPDTALNLFGDGLGVNNPKTLEHIMRTPHNSGRSYLEDWNIKASGDLFKLPGDNMVKLAFGGEFRREFYSNSFSAPIGSVVSFGGAGSAGGRQVESVYVEGDIPLVSKKNHIPLIEEFELTAAERYDHYSDFGDSTKPKFGFKYKPFNGLLFRGSYDEGFRAPSLPQLFTGTVSSFDTVTNPRTGQTGDVAITTGGDPNLKPENSYSYFLGAIVEPPFIKGLSVEFDWYHIQQRNLILQPTAQDVVNGLAGGTVTYDGNGQITNVNELFTNLGEIVTQGFDIDVNYKWETKIGTFSFDNTMTYMDRYKQSATAGAPLQDLQDTFQLPDFKLISSIFYRKGGFEAGVTVNFTDSYDDQRASIHQETHKIGNWTTVDLQMSYEWTFDPPETGLSKESKDAKAEAPPVTVGLHGWKWWLNNTKLTIGCNNVGDSEPPFANQEEGYDTATADPTGRFIYASLRKKFW